MGFSVERRLEKEGKERGGRTRREWGLEGSEGKRGGREQVGSASGGRVERDSKTKGALTSVIFVRIASRLSLLVSMPSMTTLPSVGMRRRRETARVDFPEPVLCTSGAERGISQETWI
jgi:hypothetical protein